MNCSFAEFVEIYNSSVLADHPSYQNYSGLYIPKKHIEVCDFLEKNQTGRRVLMAHRSFGKSDLVALYPVWKMYQDPDYTCLYVGATSSVPRTLSEYIRKIIETHPLTKHLVPTDNALWQRTSFTVNRTTPAKEPTMRISSVAASKTGFRPQEIICDDLEDAGNCDDEEARNKLRRCITECMNLCPNIIFIGTPHAEETIYSEVSAQGAPTLKIPVFGYDPFGNPYKSIEDGGQLQVPEFKTIEWANDIKANTTSANWESQYLLIPKASYEVELDPEMLMPFTGPMKVETRGVFMNPFNPYRATAFVNDEELKDLKAYWDPASGGKNRDNSVIAVLGVGYTGNVYILALEALPEVTKESTYRVQMDRILKVLEAHHCERITVESNFIPTLHNELKRYAKEHSKKVIVKESFRAKSKDRFISECIEPLLTVRRLYCRPEILRDTSLGTEMKEFRRSNKDDHIDAVAGCIAELKIPRVSSGMNSLSSTPLNRGPEVIQVNDYSSFN